MLRASELAIYVLATHSEVYAHEMPGMTETSTTSSTSSADSDMTMTMMNVFHTGMGDSLFWASWRPTTKVAYAFTFLALVLLGMASRALSAFIIRWDRNVRAKNLHRARTITISSKTGSRASIDESQDNAKNSTESIKESKELYTTASRPSSVGESRVGTEQDATTRTIGGTTAKDDQVSKIANAWRISVDMPRGLLQFLSHALGFLMMLAVMTGNVGYFFAVLVGVFIGEVAFGRLAHSC